jgi:DNA primase
MAAIDEIKARLSIEDVVGSYVALEPAGKYLRARCPFHNEKTASFVVTPDRGIFHCFGCGKGGDIFTFVQEVDHMTFPEALELLAGRAGVVLDSRDNQDSGKRVKVLEAMDLATRFYAAVLEREPTAREYIKSRGITDETVRNFRIGYAPTGGSMLVTALQKRGMTMEILEAAGLVIHARDGRWYDRFRERVMFPISDAQGKVVAFSGRALPGTREAERAAKYINSPETILYHKGKVLYGFDRARADIAKAGSCICVEGQMDLVLAHQAGTANTVAVSGTAVTSDHVRTLGRYTQKLILALDADTAGIRASQKLVQLAFAADMAVDAIVLPTGADPADIIRENPETWRALIAHARPYVTVRAESFSDLEPEARARAVLSELIPLVAQFQSQILQDEALRSVSNVTNVSIEALRADVRRTESKQASVPLARPQNPASAPLSTVQTSLDETLDRMFGLLQDANAEITQKAKTAIDALVAPGTFDSFRDARQENAQKLAFQSDLLYGELTDAQRNAKLQGLIEDWWRTRLEQDIRTISEAIAEAESVGRDSSTLLMNLAELVKQRSRSVNF